MRFASSHDPPNQHISGPKKKTVVKVYPAIFSVLYTDLLR